MAKDSQFGVGHASLFDVTSCTRLQTLQHAEYAYSRGGYDDNSPFEWSPDNVKLAVHYPSRKGLVVGCLTRQTCSEREVSQSAFSCEVQLQAVTRCAASSFSAAWKCYAGVPIHCSPDSVLGADRHGAALGPTMPVVCSMKGRLGQMASTGAHAADSCASTSGGLERPCLW